MYLLMLPVVIIIVSAIGFLWVFAAVGTPTGHLRGQIFSAAGVTAGAALLGSAAVALTWVRWPSYLPQGVLAAMAVRLLVTLVGVVVVALTLTQADPVFFLGTAGFYIIGLISETILAIRIVRKGYVGQSLGGDVNGSVPP